MLVLWHRHPEARERSPVGDKKTVGVAHTMPPHLQTVFEHGKGNALQACVATLLGADTLDSVPNFIKACVPAWLRQGPASALLLLSALLHPERV